MFLTHNKLKACFGSQNGGKRGKCVSCAHQPLPLAITTNFYLIKMFINVYIANEIQKYTTKIDMGTIVIHLSGRE